MIGAGEGNRTLVMSSVSQVAERLSELGSEGRGSSSTDFLSIMEELSGGAAPIDPKSVVVKCSY
jgi:hypothetical protein